jgi:hypothetical protein
MSKYTVHNVGISDAKARKLLLGGKIMITKGELDGDKPLLLLQTQLKRLQKAKLSGKGMNLALSQGHCRHLGMNGGGFWGDIWKGIKKGAKALLPFAKPLIQIAREIPVVKQAIDTGAILANSVVPSLKLGDIVKKEVYKVGGENSDLSNAVGAIAHRVGPQYDPNTNQLIGEKLKKARKPRVKKN